MKEILLTQVLPPLFNVTVLAIVGWAMQLLTRLTGLQVDARHREALQSALLNGAKLLLLPGGTIDEAIDYVQRSVPDALRHFNLHERDDVREYLEPKILDLGGTATKAIEKAGKADAPFALGTI